MSNVMVFKSCFWWSPFLRTVSASADFKRFCINGDVSSYVEQMRRTVIGKEKGFFFYAVDRNTNGLLAISAVSQRGNELYVHFYWASNYHKSERPLIKNIFDQVRQNFPPSSISAVMFPVPIESLGVWDGYGKRVYDEHKRRIVWYKFPLKDFATFTQYVSPDQAQVFVA